MRDSKGKFIHGHKVLSVRDPVTGQFTVKDNMSSAGRYAVVRSEVDIFLKSRECSDE